MRENEIINLSESQGEVCVIFFRDLRGKLSKFRDKVCKNL